MILYKKKFLKRLLPFFTNLALLASIINSLYVNTDDEHYECLEKLSYKYWMKWQILLLCL